MTERTLALGVPGRAASQTALLIAGYRARASQAEEPICHDPWAALLGGDDAEALCCRWDAHWPAMGLWVALRTRYIDDCVTSALDAGIRQVVILGAGLDTRAARLGRPGARFFEVDQPASQADKQTRLDTITGYPSDAATFVACDFEEHDFSDRLSAAGLDRNAPVCFVWEGVVYYLCEEAARTTLSKIATGFDRRSVLVFDYLNSRLTTSSDRLREEDRAMTGIVEELGEPMKFGIDDATPLMHEAGFRFLRTVSYDELALQYTGTYDRDRYFRFQSIALASAGDRALPW